MIIGKKIHTNFSSNRMESFQRCKQFESLILELMIIVKLRPEPVTKKGGIMGWLTSFFTPPVLGER